MTVDLSKFEPLFEQHMRELCDEVGDVSHDLSHVLRVVQTAKEICKLENGDINVVVPAAYLHDCVYISKKDPRRSQASTISADFAMDLLTKWNYPKEFHADIHHAVCAHSFSANIKPQSLEAMIVQDADRIDGLGAIGVCRSMAFTGFSNRPMYNIEDPFCENGRVPDDSQNTLDHYFIKLLKVADLACTESGKRECLRRTEVMREFLKNLKLEIHGTT